MTRSNRYLRDIPLPGLEDGTTGYRGPNVCKIVGITYRQLDYWATTGLVKPSVRDADGSGSQRLYSFEDIVLLRTRKATLPDDELADFPLETDIHEALQKHKPDAVIVANPTALHLDVAVPAAAAGHHMLLEKPVSDSLDRLDVLQGAAQKSGSRILVGFQFRYHPTLNQARELIQLGALGKILTVHAHWGEYLPQWHPWEDYRQSYAARADLGGGVIVTFTHPLDFLRSLVGEVESLKGLVDPAGKKVTLLGAGGAARAIAPPLVRRRSRRHARPDRGRPQAPGLVGHLRSVPQGIVL